MAKQKRKRSLDLAVDGIRALLSATFDISRLMTAEATMSCPTRIAHAYDFASDLMESSKVSDFGNDQAHLPLWSAAE